MKARYVIPALAAALAIAAAPARAAPGEKPVKLEDVPGSPVKKITLTEKARERLGIEVGKVGEQSIQRRQVVGGLVVAASQVRQSQPQRSFGGFAPVASPGLQPVAEEQRAAAPMPAKAADGTWVLLTLSPGEYQRLAKEKPARLMPLETRGTLGKPVMARPSGMPPVEDAKRSMLHVYYVVPDGGTELEHNRRMRVELELEGSDARHKVVPYSALYYDAKGKPWVYLNPQPLVYQRSPVAVERIAGDVAVLKEGPELGAAVVTVGAPLLYGTEIFKK